MREARYNEPKARSAEVLRMALLHMGQHAAAFNPVTFTVWYEFAAGGNPKLNAAIEGLTRASAPIDDDCVARLYRDHIAPADAQAVERISVQMHRLMSSMAQSATHTGNQAGAFGNQLDGLTQALASQDVGQLAPKLNEVLAGTAEMKLAVHALEKEVTDSQAEITKLRGALLRAQGEALIDPLTGILNRKGFDLRLNALLAHPSGDTGCHCLVMLDIDHFKKVNDTHGHLVGDRVIQAVGEILRTSVTDPKDAAARYGGEEFAILVRQTSLEQCLRLAEQIRERTRSMKLRHRSTQEVLLTVSMSGGIAQMQPGDDAAALISRADAALYRSKAQGRDRLTCA